MGKLERKIEKYDQYFAWIVIILVALWLGAQNYFAFTVFIFSIFLLAILFILNKGRKSTVNLRSDITPLVLLVILAFLIMLFVPENVWTIILIFFLMGLATLLYR